MLLSRYSAANRGFLEDCDRLGNIRHAEDIEPIFLQNSFSELQLGGIVVHAQD
jgi:hypothetical protein